MRDLPTGADRYSLLASGVAGRQLTVATTEGPPFADRHTVYVDAHSPMPVVVVALHAALVGAGSLERPIVSQLVGSREVARRYFTLEAVRACAALDGRLPRRVASTISAMAGNGVVSPSPAMSLKRAQGRERLPLLDGWLGGIRPRAVLRLDAGASAEKAATDTARPHRDELLPALPELEDDDDGERSRILEILAAPVPGSSVLSRMFGDLLGLKGRRRPDGSSSGGNELPVSGAVAVEDLGPRAPRMPLMLHAVPAGPAGIVDGVYPEWDGRRRRYKPGWCVVGEYDPQPSGGLTPVIRPPAWELRRKLARLGLSVQRHRRQPDGESLDLEALVDFMVASAASVPGDDRVFEARRRTARDLGVLVMLDVSGSTGENRLRGGSIHDEQVRLAADLVGTLDDLGDRSALFAFKSYGRRAVRLLRVKDFDDRFEESACRRLAAVRPGGFTRMGAAIRHGTRVLSTRAGTINQVLVVVSDGLPYDDGYEADYAENDTRQALAEARAQGVGCVCLSIGTAVGDAALERVFGSSAHARLTRAADASNCIEDLFRAALHFAAVTQRGDVMRRTG